MPPRPPSLPHALHTDTPLLGQKAEKNPAMMSLAAARFAVAVQLINVMS